MIHSKSRFLSFLIKLIKKRQKKQKYTPNFQIKYPDSYIPHTEEELILSEYLKLKEIHDKMHHMDGSLIKR